MSIPHHLDAIDHKILGFINERMTYQEMTDALHRSARSGMYTRIEKLITAGLVSKSTRKSRSRRLTDEGQRILDSVSSV